MVSCVYTHTPESSLGGQQDVVYEVVDVQKVDSNVVAVRVRAVDAEVPDPMRVLTQVCVLFGCRASVSIVVWIAWHALILRICRTRLCLCL